MLGLRHHVGGTGGRGSLLDRFVGCLPVGVGPVANQRLFGDDGGRDCGEDVFGHEGNAERSRWRKEVLSTLGGPEILRRHGGAGHDAFGPARACEHFNAFAGGQLEVVGEMLLGDQTGRSIAGEIRPAGHVDLVDRRLLI